MKNNLEKKLKIEHVSIGELKESEYNPRNLSQEDEKVLTKSMQRFKFLDPIIVNKYIGREGIIISGHQRFKIAKKLGYKEVPVLFVNLDPQQEKALNLSMNKAVGKWDMELLKQFDMSLLLDTGFSNEDLTEIFDESLEITNDNFDETKELQKIKSTDIKIGDKYQLGKHFLVCGNSHKKGTLDMLMGDIKADLIINDPIYNISNRYNSGVGGHANYCDTNINDNKTDDEYKEFLRLGMENSLRHAKDDCHFFTWCDQRYIFLVQLLYAELGLKNERACFWFKGSFSPCPNSTFNKAVEFCIYSKRGRPYLSKLSRNVCEVMNKEIGTGNISVEDILESLEMWIAKRDPWNQYNHSTQKPLDLYQKPLLRCTAPNDIVLDIYGGSGVSTLSCQQIGRICYTSELNPIFCQLIINRFEKLTKIKVKKVN